LSIFWVFYRKVFIIGHYNARGVKNIDNWLFLVRPKTIVFGRTYVLRMMFFYSTRDLRDAWADRREILHDGQY